MKNPKKQKSSKKATHDSSGDMGDGKHDLTKDRQPVLSVSIHNPDADDDTVPDERSIDMCSKRIGMGEMKSLFATAGMEETDLTSGNGTMAPPFIMTVANDGSRSDNPDHKHGVCETIIDRKDSMVTGVTSKTVSHHKTEPMVAFHTNSPEGVQEALMGIVNGIIHDDGRTSLDYLQEIDDAVLATDPRSGEPKSPGFKSLHEVIQGLYDSSIGDSVIAYSSDTRFKIVVLSLVYACTREYGECAVTLREEHPNCRHRPILH